VGAVLSAPVVEQAVRISAEDSGRYRRFGNCNLFARQNRFDLIKLSETIALHAYATII
jgi:hypothetical protein